MQSTTTCSAQCLLLQAGGGGSDATCGACRDGVVAENKAAVHYGSTDESDSASYKSYEEDEWYQVDQSYEFLRPVADFLVGCTSFPQLLMWGFLAWYVAVIYFSLPLSTKPFKDACVIMVLVGLVLNVNAFVAYQHHVRSCPASIFEPTLVEFLQRQPASIARLFVIPFCVSCYSGVSNSATAGGFVSIFPTSPSILFPGIFGFFAFPLSLRLASNLLSHLVYPVESLAHRNQRMEASAVEIKL